MEPPIEIDVYLCEGGHYVLVPGCFLPTRACIRAHGPLHHCGVLWLADEAGTGEFGGLMEELESAGYAIRERAAARRLMELDPDYPRIARLSRRARVSP